MTVAGALGFALDISPLLGMKWARQVIMRLKMVGIFLCGMAVLAAAQSRMPIRGTHNTRLGGTVRDAIAMGGIKDVLACDAGGNIYTPANRGYGSAYGSVVRIAADGEHFTRYSIDDLPGLNTGHIEAFEVAGNEVYVLAREVAKYNERIVPVEFGNTFVVRFDSDGKIKGRTRLATDFGKVTPTGLATLQGTDLFVTGYQYDESNQTEQEFAFVLAANGALKSRVPLTPQGTQAANSEFMNSMSVVRPTVVKANGFLYVLRGSTRDSVFIFSLDGTLQRKLTLQGDYIEFSSPKVLGNRLLVHKHTPTPPSDGEIRIRRDPQLEVFPVFDLETGVQVDQLEWHSPGELACFEQRGITVIQEDFNFPLASYWAIVRAAPREPKKPAPIVTSVSLQIYWVVPCAAGLTAVPLRDDEAARRYCLSQEPLVDDREIAEARAEPDAFGRLGMRLSLTATGADTLHHSTAEAADRQLAMVINKELMVVAVVHPRGLTHEVWVPVSRINSREVRQWVKLLNEQAQQRENRKVAALR